MRVGPRVQVQGGIINFELRSPSGQPMSYKTFEREASEAGFHLRTGAECNPGACYAYLGAPLSIFPPRLRRARLLATAAFPPAPLAPPPVLLFLSFPPPLALVLSPLATARAAASAPLPSLPAPTPLVSSSLAAAAAAGVADAEVEQLAGVKEGCEDDVEFITVQRPSEAPPAAVHSDETLRLLSSSQRLALGHPAEVASK